MHIHLEVFAFQQGQAHGAIWLDNGIVEDPIGTFRFENADTTIIYGTPPI